MRIFIYFYYIFQWVKPAFAGWNPLAPIGLLALVIICIFTLPLHAQSRIKDIVSFEGVRDNMLVGYGLVVGLNGTGDTLKNSIFTKESLVGMLERLGVNARDGTLEAKNVAAVMVTATLPPFSRQGSKIDIQVSALGDAKNLQGGTLLVTPLLGADGEVYVVAQGNISVTGTNIQGAAAALNRGVPTSGRIASGGIIEKEIPFKFSDLKQIHLNLRNPDFTTARRVSQAINSFIGLPVSEVLDPGTILMGIPPSYINQSVDLLTDIEQLRIEPDQIARILIDEQSGTIVMGENVRINQVAIAQGNLSIRVSENITTDIPQPFNNAGGLLNNGTATTPANANNGDNATPPANANNNANATPAPVANTGPPKKLGVFKTGVSIQELVNGLNSLGVGPRDMITILQAIKAAGALQAEIEVM